MTITYRENFQSFRDVGDLRTRGPAAGWRVAAGATATLRRAANSGPFGNRPNAGIGEGTILAANATVSHVDTSSVPGDRCIHIAVIGPSSGRSFKLGLTDAAMLDRSSAAPNLCAIDFECVTNPVSDSSPTPVRVYHRVHTAAGGVNTNSLLLGEIPGMVAGRSYTIEVRLHLDGENSRVDVYWNGKMYQFPFNPARLITGFEAIAFNHTLIHTYSYCYVADFVVYRDDSVTPFPTGGMIVDTVEPTDTKLRISELDDGTSVTLSNDQLVTIPLSAIAAGGEILDIAVVARIGASTGNMPIRAEIRATHAGDTFIAFDEQIPVSAPVQLVHKKLPDSFRAAPNDIVIAARGKPGV